MFLYGLDSKGPECLSSGGAAAINGFLYQIIHHIDWLAKATLVASPHDNELRNARIVLEPPGGGDAVAQSEDRYLVEQYKPAPCHAHGPSATSFPS